MRHQSLRLVVGIVTSLAIIGGSSSLALSAEKVTIRIASGYTGTSGLAPAWDKALTEWAAAHEDSVNLVREETPGDEHRNKMTVDLGADNVADVFAFWTGPASMNPFLDANLLLDMSEYFALSKDVTIDKWTPAAIASSTFDGKPYALPIESFKCFMLYNTEIFDQYGQQPPTTNQELLQVAKVFTENSIVPLNVGSKGGNPGHMWWNDMLFQLPNGVEEGQAVGTSYDVSTPAWRQATEIVADQVKNNVFPKDTTANGDWPPSVELYNQRKAAMVYTCPWMIGAINEDVAGISEMMYVPTVDGAAIPGTQFNVGNTVHGLMINQDSFHDTAKQALIVDLVDYLMRDEVLNAYVEAGTFPAWIVSDPASINISPLTSKIVEFTSTSPDTYTIVAGLFSTAPGLTNFLDAMDLLFAGGDPVKIIDDLQVQITAEEQ